jgi:hypothetical protein
VLQDVAVEPVLLLSNASGEVEEGRNRPLWSSFDDGDEAETVHDVDVELDADEPRVKFIVDSLDRQFEFFVENLGRDDLLYLFVVKIKEIAQSDVVDLFVPIGNHVVEFLPQKFPF